ncbi:MAG: ATP-binding region, ATPase domain protein [Propionibacteriaceae bacterium]|jgi:two-component system OmpR family sensor kinase|nr:ATP-binding region, ATPase domain protein [Propionibacteriaceae bacterium]
MTRMTLRLARLPLRVRLVAGFSATMLLVLTATAAFVYWRVSFALDRQINEELSELSSLVAPFVTPEGQIAREAPRLPSDEVYQVLAADGSVLAYSSSLGPEPLLAADVARRALSEPVRADVGRLLPTNRRPLHAYATALPVARSQRAALLVVGLRRDERDETLLELLVQLVVAGFGALVVTALVGDRLARLALRPVERYRAQAADIVAGASGVRLDVPPDRDDEVTRLGHTLNATLDALEAALERERRFVNDASHELRTPLTLLKARVQLALRRRRTVDEHEQVLAEIETDLVRLTQLAGQLLHVGTQSALDVAAEPTDLAAVAIQEAARSNALLDGDSPGSQQAVRVWASGAIYVALGELQVSQLLASLLDNASVHGRPPVTVTVDAVPGAGRLVVVDSGDGMDAALLATATHRFTRAAESRSRPGFGLGLSLVEAIVTHADGELRLCYAGTHQRFGRLHPARCEHGDEMAVTVLLPQSSAAPVHAFMGPSSATA